jgi:ATP-binding cassette subfamily A (ABC1) protein 3
LRLIPSFAFGYGVLSIGNRELFNLVIEDKGFVPSSLSMDVAGADILFLGWTGFFYFFLIFVVEKLLSSTKINKLFTHENNVPYVDKQYDDDVQNEFTRINGSDPKDYTVRVKDLRKVYMMEDNRHKVAVDKVSFGIKNGEVFTLLGVNGAGKTTTFKILSGEIQ